MFNSNALIYKNEQPPRGIDFYKKYLKLSIKDLYWKFLLKKQNTIRRENKKYYISICSIFKNEAPFMREWIEFHLLMGVNHFFLYNNNSTDDYQSILHPYIDKGIVTLVQWPEIPGQLSAYTHFYNTFRHESQWVSFLDLDEFICPRYAKDIPTWLNDYKQYPLILLYWRMFGTSGKVHHDENQLVIEQYVVCWEKLYVVGKLLWNTDYDIAKLHLSMMHYFDVIVQGHRMPPINVWKKFVYYKIHRIDNSAPSIQVNHYWSKAFDCYEKKHARGSAAFGESWKTLDVFINNLESYNKSTDYTIFRFLINLKLKLCNYIR